MIRLIVLLYESGEDWEKLLTQNCTQKWVRERGKNKTSDDEWVEINLWVSWSKKRNMIKLKEKFKLWPSHRNRRNKLDNIGHSLECLLILCNLCFAEIFSKKLYERQHHHSNIKGYTNAIT